MKSLNVCINSQTPLIRFKLQHAELLEKYGELPDPLPLEMLAEGEDYEICPGGVPKILYPLVTRMIDNGLANNAHWVSLNPVGPRRITAGKIILHNVGLEIKDITLYSRMKERLWQEMHDLERQRVGPEEFVAYAKYNWLCAAKMLELMPVDLFYIHDFQQLQVGNMIGLAGPTLLRWHIPLEVENIDPYIRHFIIKCMEAFDAVVVSCKRDLEGLIRAGYHGTAYQVYPYVDERKWDEPSSSDEKKFCSDYGIKDDDKMILVVGRMDPIKGQEIVIKAAAQLAGDFPNLKVVFVGNGSFTGSAEGGLAHPKATTWRKQLQNLTMALGVEKNVKFTGYLPDDLLKAAYKRADVLVLPSKKEGFGLVVPEAWLYKKPVVVSRGAGVSEMIIEETNGYTFPPGDVRTLVEKLRTLLKNSELAIRMGERGNETVKVLFMEEGVKKIYEIMEEVIERFKK